MVRHLSAEFIKELLNGNEGSPWLTTPVYVFCDDCADVHSMGIKLDLNDGPADKQSVGEVYNEKLVSPELLALHNNSVTARRLEGSFIRKIITRSRPG